LDYHPLRWELMLLYADGRLMSATDAAPAVHRSFHIVLKHLRILREARPSESSTEQSGCRFLLYYMPEQWRPRAGVLDFGWCVMNLPTSGPT